MPILNCSLVYWYSLFINVDYLPISPVLGYDLRVDIKPIWIKMLMIESFLSRRLTGIA